MVKIQIFHWSSARFAGIYGFHVPRNGLSKFRKASNFQPYFLHPRQSSLNPDSYAETRDRFFVISHIKLEGEVTIFVQNNKLDASQPEK